MSSASIEELKAELDLVQADYKAGKLQYKDYLEAWYKWNKALQAEKDSHNSLYGLSPASFQYAPSKMYESLDDAIDSLWPGELFGESGTTKTEEAQTCERGYHDWKVYDSGFRRFEYCAKCSAEKHDT